MRTHYTIHGRGPVEGGEFVYRRSDGEWYVGARDCAGLRRVTASQAAVVICAPGGLWHAGRRGGSRLDDLVGRRLGILA